MGYGHGCSEDGRDWFLLLGAQGADVVLELPEILSQVVVFGDGGPAEECSLLLE